MESLDCGWAQLESLDCAKSKTVFGGWAQILSTLYMYTFEYVTQRKNTYSCYSILSNIVIKTAWKDSKFLFLSDQVGNIQLEFGAINIPRYVTCS